MKRPATVLLLLTLSAPLLVAGSTGKRLLLSFKNKTREEIVLVVPAGSSGFEAGSPLGALEITADQSETFVMRPGASTAPLEVGQRGSRGAVEGEFTVLTYEGEPLMSGSVTVGPLEREMGPEIV